MSLLWLVLPQPFEEENYLDKIKNIADTLKHACDGFSAPNVVNARSLGAVGIIEVNDSKHLKAAQAYAIQNGIWLRPFSKFLYTMPAYIIKTNELKRITNTMHNYLKSLK